jgi:hypothetical protein
VSSPSSREAEGRLWVARCRRQGRSLPPAKRRMNYSGLQTIQPQILLSPLRSGSSGCAPGVTTPGSVLGSPSSSQSKLRAEAPDDAVIQLSRNRTDPSKEGVQRRPLRDLESAFDCGINTLEAEALRRALHRQRLVADFPAASRSTGARRCSRPIPTIRRRLIASTSGRIIQ